MSKQELTVEEMFVTVFREIGALQEAKLRRHGTSASYKEATAVGRRTEEVVRLIRAGKFPPARNTVVPPGTTVRSLKAMVQKEGEGILAWIASGER